MKTDRQRDEKKLTVAFRSYANASKKWQNSSNNIYTELEIIQNETKSLLKKIQKKIIHSPYIYPIATA